MKQMDSGNVNRRYVIASIIFIVTVVAASTYIAYALNMTPTSIPSPTTIITPSPTAPAPSPISDPALPLDWTISPQGIINASQGTTQEINITFTSILDDQQTMVPIENLTLTYYDSQIDYNNWGTNNSLNFPQDKYFTYSFSQTQLAIQPLASNTTILTIKIANDALLGEYSFNINLGNITINSQSQTDSLYLAMVVAPKGTSSQEPGGSAGVPATFATLSFSNATGFVTTIYPTSGTIEFVLSPNSVGEFTVTYTGFPSDNLTMSYFTNPISVLNVLSNGTLGTGSGLSVTESSITRVSIGQLIVNYTVTSGGSDGLYVVGLPSTFLSTIVDVGTQPYSGPLTWLDGSFS